MKRNKPLSKIAEDLCLPWSVEWDSLDGYAPDVPSDNSPHWRIIGEDNSIRVHGMRRPDAQFVADAVNAAAGGYGLPRKQKFKRGDVVRVIAPFDHGVSIYGVRIAPRCVNWVGQRAIVENVSGNTYGIYLSSEGPKSYCAWWDENCLEPYCKPPKGISV